VIRRRRAIALLAVVAAAVVLLVAWAVPTFIGGAFVSVRAIVVPVTGTGSGSGIKLADGSTVTSGRVRIDLQITNLYPLPVVVSFQGPAFEAQLRTAGQAAAATAWRTTAEDQQLEQDQDSPDGVSSARVALVEPGTRTVSMTSPGATLDLSLAPGVVTPESYWLATSAYGIAAPAQPLATVSAPKG
jgi:ferric-dicitrate binding protein FerR (iron transport regulator)